MNKFKAGDKVQRTCGELKGMKVGDVSAVTGLARFSCMTLEGYDGEHDMDNFKLVDEKESTSVWLKENKWFIRTGSPEKSKLVQEWLFEHGCEWLYDGKNAQTGFNDALLTNTDYDGNKEKYIMFSKSDSKDNNAQEIVLELETTIKSVQLPDVTPKKTEQQLRIEELEATIAQASAQIKQLKEEV